MLSLIQPGGSTIYMTVSLTNARLTAIHQFTEGGTEYVDVSFTYQTINISWIDPSVTTQDDWAAPSV